MAVVSLAIVLLVLMATCKSLGLKHSARIKHFRLFEALNQEVPVELPVGSAVERLMGGRHVLDLSFDELTEGLGGSGKAKLFWEALRSGTDPLTAPSGEFMSLKARGLLDELLQTQNKRIGLLPTRVTLETGSSCGTRKFLQSCDGDGAEIESVLIPSHNVDRTTLCVSTQIGCDRGCRFCATGKMGLIRDLSAGEIVSQVVRGLEIANREQLPPLTNVVFMGMGDAGRNLRGVGPAVRALADRKKMNMAQSKLTVSTVGPSPEIFQEIADLPCTISWSLHSPDNVIRRQMVPSTRHTTEELREGLMRALETRHATRTRTCMIACTLVAGVNDRPEDALKLAAFCKPILEVAPKIALDLIPYNDIGGVVYKGFDYKPPSTDAVQKFQTILREHGFFVGVRMPRGNEENAACGMLATQRKTKQAQAKE